MSTLLPFEEAFSNARVLVTGHTGFKGGWLCRWLQDIGAETYGIALAPNTTPSMFDSLSNESECHSILMDIRNREALIETIIGIDPKFVFHLAAQPLVRESYASPIDTVETNVLGTCNVLEASRQAPNTKACVVVTTDKVYLNHESRDPYVEVNPLGGADPYSASKSAAEMIVQSYQKTLSKLGNNVAIASARGGNVIGGGDWSADRLIPDLVTAIVENRPVSIRNPAATRPWQHVLTLCHGYLMLASELIKDSEAFVGAWNFGPSQDDTIDVSSLINLVGSHWKTPQVEAVSSSFVESQHLFLDSTKARKSLNWVPSWGLESAVEKTCHWYRTFYDDPKSIIALTRQQIREYRSSIRSAFS